ncbi:M1 family metallopeptidase [Actinokineospora sp. NBRC 105648]|uniref:M1 family metallopeptidase n=1 Tax=Actinokineospora sp. NBRC 105648 TaxID=3032206 RepID=UPI00249FE664|nr:M1 family metallopeptidase [Actinokineospora sp. NBRC 105648]GLZ40375.1 peptidase [Actinokineospora sp. NBRC 105648]
MPRVAPVRVVCVLLTATMFTACTSAGDETGKFSKSNEPAPWGVGSPGIGDPYYPDDGNGGYDVTAYEVSISYDPATRQLMGDTTVVATATAALSRYNLDLTGFDVSEVDVDGGRAATTRDGEHELVITPAAPLTKGATFRTRVRYTGVPTADKDSTLGAGGWQIAKSGGAFAAGEPHSASSWYPVNDHPSDKATFRLAARVPDGWSVISNGREEPAKTEGGWTTYTWVEPNRIAPYLTTVGIDRWTFERSALPDGTPVVNAYAPGAQDKRRVEARVPEVLAFLAGKFGPYPQSAAGGIFLNESIGFSLETQGRPTYAKWADLDVIVHEQAHQWFGDSVSLERWSDVCLNECFASYAQWLWREKEGEDLDATFRTEVARASDKFWKRRLVDMGPGNEFTAVYDKGQLAVHALRRQLGEERFDTLLKKWTQTHRDGNASWAEFTAMVNEVSGHDQSAFLQAWFHQADKPAEDLLYPGSLRK